MSDDFVSLHQHSDFSKLDGLGRTSAYLKAAAEAGQPAMALTEHGSMRGVHELALRSKGGAVRPIYGIEFYVAQDMHRRGLTDTEKDDATRGVAKKAEQKAAIKAMEDREGIRDRWHLCAWAMNEVGLKNLYRLSSKAWLEGFYYSPRIDLMALFEHREGVAVSTGCLNSPVNDRVVAGKRKEAFEVADQLREAFGEDLWLELQPHAVEEGGRRLQEEANRFVLGLAERYNTRNLLATQDAHYVCEGDHESHEVLLCVGTGTTLSDLNRFKFSGTDFHFRTREQMRRAFDDAHPYIGEARLRLALDNTLALAERCRVDVVLDPLKGLMPPVEVPGEYDGNEFAYIQALCVEGWRWKDVAGRAERMARRKSCPHGDALLVYKNRLKHELRALRNQKFVGYMLLVRDLYEWMRKSEIMVGPGRGSAAGSLVSFLLGITSVDPIEHGLLFERFVSPDRIGLPDVDCDVPDMSRGEILAHLREKYGDDRFCQIATVGRLLGKQAIKDVCRVLGVPFNEANSITDLIIHRNPGDDRLYDCVADSFSENDALKKFGDRFPGVLRHASKLEGTAKSLGIHAAGVVISPVPLTDVLPLETRKQDDGGGGDKVVVTAFDMRGVEDFGLVKMDVLGLRTLTVLSDAAKAVERQHGVKVDYENMLLDDEAVLRGFTERDFVGVFQFDTSTAERGCEGVDFTHFSDIAAFTSLIRPGPAEAGLLDEWRRRKRDPERALVDTYHPKISAITRDTLGVLTYQEQVMQITVDVAGWSGGEADKFRKTVAKKLGAEAMEKEREKFLAGVALTTPDFEREAADEFFTDLLGWASYGFNRSHAVAYGALAYWTMAMKRRYPSEFFWAVMRSEPDQESVQHVAGDARRHGVELRPPDVNLSGVGFTLHGSSIRGSILDIKGVGDGAANAITEAQPFSSVGDFLRRVSRKAVNRRGFEMLLRAGAFSPFSPNERWILENLDEFWESAKMCQENPDLGVPLVDGIVGASRALPAYSREQRSVVASEVRPTSFGDDPMEVYADFVRDNVRVDVADAGREEFWEENHGRGAWVLGTVEELQGKQVGDHHDGDAPDDDEKARMGWGRRFATFSIRCRGAVLRSKLSWEAHDAFVGELTANPGAPVLALVTPDKKYRNARTRAVVNLESWRAKLEAGQPLGLWERVAGGRHPAEGYPWADEVSREVAKRDIGEAVKSAKRARTKARVVALVSSVFEKPDKNGNVMGFLGLLGWKGYVEALCFTSLWKDVRESVQVGRLFQMDLKCSDGVVVDGGLKWLKRVAP